MLYIDQSADKQACIDLLQSIGCLELSAGKYQSQIKQIERIISHWHVNLSAGPGVKDGALLMAIIRSQLMSGHVKAAVQVVNSMPDRRLKRLPLIVVSILRFPLRLTTNILATIIDMGTRR